MKRAMRIEAGLTALPGLAIVLVLLLVVLVACGTTSPQPATSTQGPSASDTSVVESAGSGAPEVAQVDLIMDWMPWVLDIPIDVAQVKGFYQEQGLTVTQTLPAGPTDVVKFVSTGKSQFGLYYSPDLIMALEEGAPLLSLGAVMSHAPVGVALKPGFTADSPAALAGKTVSIPLIPSTRASFESMLVAGGVDSGGVQVIDPGYELVAPLLTGKVDAAAFTEFGELVQVQEQGQELTYLDFREWGTPDFAFLDLITTQEFARSNPNTTRAFVRATYQGLAWAVAHPEEAVELYVAAHPELEASLLLAQWKAAVPFLAVAAAHKPAGWQDLEAWTSLNAWMKAGGLVQGTADLSAAVSNDYLDAGE